MRRTIAVLASAAMLATLTGTANAAPAGTESSGPQRSAQREAAPASSWEAFEQGMRESQPELDRGGERGTYIVILDEPPVPSYDGGREGFRRTSEPRARDFRADSSDSQRYARRLEADQQAVVARNEAESDSDIDVKASWQFALNGFSAVMTADQANALAKDPDVLRVEPEFERELQTDVGPEWIDADDAWIDPPPGLGTSLRGEGVVVGVIDSGINPNNPSFLDPGEGGGTGYDHVNPLDPDPLDADPGYLGVCDPDNAAQHDVEFPCNDKLIGAWSFVYDGPSGGALDDDGHGSHTASTAAGNYVDDAAVEVQDENGETYFTTDPFQIKGVAPHANIISYMGCCTGTGLVSSIDQAVIDGVDVINYSIGSTSPTGDLYLYADVVGFLFANDAGIVVATSNGNSGPGFATTGSPADAPWMLAVGASTHDRRNVNTVTLLSGADGVPTPYEGKGVTPGQVETEIVYAGDFGDPLCLYDGIPDEPDADPDEVDNTANFTGKIVVCDRGEIGRVQKSVNVAEQGAAGFVLANDEASGDSLNGDGFAVPGVHISFADGELLKAQLDADTTQTASILGVDFRQRDDFGDVMAAFSSRGPNLTVDTNVPDVVAPGVDVIAAYGASIPVQGQDDEIPPGEADYGLVEYAFLSGTSMASPHAAGAGALLTQANPQWTAAQTYSALMTTADTTVLDNDGTDADPYDMGAGRIDVDAAVDAGLLFDVGFADYIAPLIAPGVDDKLRQLNVPSFNNRECLGSCSWSRVADHSNTGPAAGRAVTWTVSIDDGDGLSVSTDRDSYLVRPSGSFGIDVIAALDESVPAGEARFGRITLVPDAPDVPPVTMPVAVEATDAIAPDELVIETNRDAASIDVPLRSVSIAEFDGRAAFAEGQIDEFSLVQDETNSTPFDYAGTNDTKLLLFDVPEGTRRFVTEILATTSPDIDLFVGVDEDGEGDADPEELVALSASGGSFETVDLQDPPAATLWVLVQNWSATLDQADPVTLGTGIVPAVSDTGQLVGPDEPIAFAEPYEATLAWDLVDAEEGDLFYGFAEFGQAGSDPIAYIPTTLFRGPDAVTKTGPSDAVDPGDTVDFTVAVQPNYGAEPVTYTITDVLPEGLTYVEDSATGSPTVTDDTLTWQVTQEPVLEATDPVLLEFSTVLDAECDAEEVVNEVVSTIDDPFGEAVTTTATVDTVPVAGPTPPPPGDGTPPPPGDGTPPPGDGTPPPTEEPTETTVARAAGGDRIATSIELSQLGWDSASTAILVRADEYPDALAAVTPGAAYDAPVLQNPNDELRDDVATELERLGANLVVVMGGPQAISQDVVADLEAMDIDVVRLAGDTRFGTAAEIAKVLVDEDLVENGDAQYERAILTLGNSPVPGQDGWVDALSAGTLATTLDLPVLLTERDALPSDTIEGLEAAVVEGGRVTIVGGPVAVSTDVEDELTELGYEVDRIDGATRWDTSVAAVEAAVEGGASLSTAIVASGRNYPDALSGAVTAWKLDGFLTLVDPSDLADSAPTRDFLAANADAIETLVVAGGPVAVSDPVVEQIRGILGVE